MKSFRIVENKISEAEFFLKKIKESGGRFDDVRYFFNAFLSASRSVTIAIQCCLSGHKDFDGWYKKHQKRLKENKIAKYMLRARNESQKEAIYHIGGVASSINQKGEQHLTYSLDDVRGELNGKEAIKVCEDFFVQLLEIVYDCLRNFGPQIDRLQYYTLENLIKIGKSFEDIEEEMGLPRGWTKGVSDKEKLRILQKETFGSAVDNLFITYLHKNRFGASV